MVSSQKNPGIVQVRRQLKSSWHPARLCIVLQGVTSAGRQELFIFGTGRDESGADYLIIPELAQERKALVVFFAKYCSNWR